MKNTFQAATPCSERARGPGGPFLGVDGSAPCFDCKGPRAPAPAPCGASGPVSEDVAAGTVQGPEAAAGPAPGDSESHSSEQPSVLATLFSSKSVRCRARAELFTPVSADFTAGCPGCSLPAEAGCLGAPARPSWGTELAKAHDTRPWRLPGTVTCFSGILAETHQFGQSRGGQLPAPEISGPCRGPPGVSRRQAPAAAPPGPSYEARIPRLSRWGWGCQVQPGADDGHGSAGGRGPGGDGERWGLWPLEAHAC